MTQTEISVKMVLDRWNASIQSCDKLLNSLKDESLLKQVAPGKNRGIYLLGHLIAVHDAMLELLDMGPKQYPQLFEPFIKEADNVDSQFPSAAELRGIWDEQCKDLNQKFSQLSTEAWFEKHTAVTAEDFANEPHRNKLNIIITRTSHLQYHLGQLQLLK